MQRLTLTATTEDVGRGVEFIEETLRKYGIKGKKLHEALLVTEESMVRLISHATEDADMEITVRRWYSTATITLSAKGAPFEDERMNLDMPSNEFGHNSEEAIRSLLLRAFEDKLAYSRKGEYNSVKISAGYKERVFALRTLGAFAIGLALAALMLLILPQQSIDSINTYVLTPIQTIFLNMLKLVTAPAVFFSIMTTSARYASFSNPGKTGARIIFGYVITSVLSVVLGIVIFTLFQPTDASAGSLSMFVNQTATNAYPDNSILHLIVNIVPDNIIVPFLNTDAAQLLFIALLSGIALGRAGQYSRMLREISDALNRFFSGTVEIVGSMIPYASLFVTMLMVLSFGFSSILTTLKVVGLVLFGFLVLVIGHLLFVAFGARLSPIMFIRKYAPGMLSTFLGGSSVGAIPDTRKYCEKSFGVSPALSSFSIPFGAVSNLDGNCVYLTITGLFLAKLCGVDILGENLVTIALMVVILSIGSSITPGSAMLALAMLMSQMGVSLTIISIVLGANALMEMLLAACNTIGDVTTTLVVAKMSKLIDLEIYYKPPVRKKKKRSARKA